MPSDPSPRLPTVTDVASLAQVSRQTVSNVLNSPDVVAPHTRARVEHAIARLGYRPHASARRLRTRRSSTLGVRLDPVQNGISGAVLDRFLHALTEQADAVGLRVTLYTATDQQDEIRQFRRLVDGADVDAFVLTSTTVDDPRIDWLVEQGADFVSFGRPWGRDLHDPARRWVDVDGRAGTAEVTAELLTRVGRRVAYLGWPAGSGVGDERRAGWAAVMADVLPPAARARLDLHVEDSVGNAAAAVEALLTAGAIPDAVVCASDTLALGASMATGGRIPVVGFDDTPVAAAIGLSSVQQPVARIATAALRLLGLVEDPSPPTGNHELVRPLVSWRDGGLRFVPADPEARAEGPTDPPR
ncbi:LacI family DNA-binding transcriptional regulator [Kineococcus gynurae]|uniref:LacI family DNA-binding transcriptional regulator n=1 Tax=Kineococcus gynurae TaxID=452979 RepID=A0ABV5LRR7_9ACTN